MNVFGIALAAGAGFMLLRYLSTRKAYQAQARCAAESSYASLSVRALDPQFSFEAGTAQRISDMEEVEEMNGSFLAYARTIIARNESGEYFWFYFRTDSPLQIKHLDQSSAKALLRDKYIEKQID